MRRIGFVLWLLAAAVSGAAWQDTKVTTGVPPALTTEQRQAITILAQRLELAQLRAQAAQTDFDKARGELSTLVKSLQKDGFDLDLQTLQYVKKAEPKKDGSQ